jgi:hypothetical protein
MDNFIKTELIRRRIYAKRSQYKTTKNTPIDLQWIWDDNIKELEKRINEL